MNGAKRFQRVKITAMDVFKPMVALLVLNIIILTVWTTKDPLSREIVVVTLDPFGRYTKTYGVCSSDHDYIFLATLGTINLGCLLLAMFQAYQARSISTDLQESGYFFMAMAFILVVSFTGIPVIIIAQGNIAAVYFISTGIIFIVCMSILTLIFISKVLALRKPKHLGSPSLPSLLSSNPDDEEIKILTSPLVMAQLEKEIQDLKKQIETQGVNNLKEDDEADAAAVETQVADQKLPIDGGRRSVMWGENKEASCWVPGNSENL